MSEPIKPLVSPFLQADAEKKQTTEFAAKQAQAADETFEEVAKRKGYVKKDPEEPEHVKQFKITILTYVLLVLGDLLIFFGAAIDFETGLWAFTPILWQALLMAVIKDTSVGIIGKMLKYYNRKL